MDNQKGRRMKVRVWMLAAATLAVAAFAGAASPVRADEAVGKPAGPFVVIVGVGQFEDKSIDPRPNADADAKALYDVFTDPKYLGVPADRAKLLTSTADAARGGQVATRDAIVKAIEAATSQTHKDDLIILAFFGRGTSAGDKTAFFTPDTIFKDRAKTAFIMGPDLEPAFKKVKGQKILLVMDVHYKGFKSGDEKVAEPTLTDVDALLFGPEDKEDSVRPQDRIMLLSGFISSDPLVKGDLGLFASTVIDALKGAADIPPHNEGYEPDGLVTSDELVKYLETEIPKHARLLGKTDKEKETQTIPIGARSSHFPITRNPAETAKVKARLDALAGIAKLGGVDAELAKEGAALLERMPKLKASQELRKDYQKLADGTMTPAAFATARTQLKEGLTLPRRDADSYARKVFDAADIVVRFSVKETNAGELVAAAIKGMYRRIEEPLPTDLEGDLKSPKDLAEPRLLALLKDARTRLGRREDLEGNKDADVSILMMLASLNDPYSVYFDEETVRKVESGLKGRFPGVGIQIRRDGVRDGLLVVTPIKGSPAFEAGIEAGDLIVRIIRSVDNKTGAPLPQDAQREYSTKGMKTDDAIGVITGKPGTPITLVVDRNGKEHTFEINRNWVSVETVLGVQRSNKEGDWDFVLDANAKIGYVRLTQFTQSTPGDLKTAIEELKGKGMKGMVLDLRGNPGGYLTAATKICEMFVGKEKLVTVKPRKGSESGPPRPYRGERNGDKSFDVVVLINGHSASASEIVSACLQDHARAVIVGERSYGKGSVQDVIPFRDTRGEIKLTIARYYPPSDRNIDKNATKGEPTDVWGVKPDEGFEVKLSREESTELETYMRDLEIIPAPGGKTLTVSEKKDKQLKAAADYLRQQIAANGKPGVKKGG